MSTNASRPLDTKIGLTSPGWTQQPGKAVRVFDSSVDFAGSRLDRAILRNANCRGANFSNASTWNVDVTNANFSGANLAGVAPHLWTGWEQTVCDAATKMPEAWECRDGHPALIPKK
jgi:hypothetical protein